MKKNINKKKLMVFSLLGILVLGLGSAVLLEYYGQIRQDVNVQQAVTLTGGACENNVCPEDLENMYSGDALVSDVYTLTNLADTSREMSLETSYNPGIVTGEIVTSYYDYSEKSYLLVEDADAVDCGSKVAGDLYVTVTPKKDSVVYEVELPTDFFDEISANINFQISLTDSDSEDNFQVTYYPGDLNWKLNWDWKFMTPSISQTTEVEGESSVLLLDEVVSVEYIDNSDSPDVVKVEINKPEAVQSFGVQASDGGLGYCPFYTPSWGDKDGDGDVYRFGGFSNQGTLSHEVVGTALTSPFTLQADGTLDFVVVNEFVSTGYGGLITTSVSPVA